MTNVIPLRRRKPSSTSAPPQEFQYQALNPYQRRIKLAWTLYQDDPADFKQLLDEIRKWLLSKQTDETRRLLLLGVCVDYVATIDPKTPSLAVVDHLQELAKLYGMP